MTRTDGVYLSERSAAGSNGERSSSGHDRYQGALERPEGLTHGSPPPVPSIAIRRMRLEEPLEDHPDRRVVLVRGPAGAGKTVMVAQWVAAHSDPCAWLSIDVTHNHPDRLLWHLVEAVEHLSPAATDTAVARPPTGGDIDHTVVRDLLDLVSCELSTRITLVVDDVHRLGEASARHVLGQLVEHPPTATRVVLISRSKPRVGLERARLRDDLVEVPPAMLRFERAEIDRLVAAWTDYKGEVNELEQSTLGWAAGLRLAQLEATAHDASAATWGERDAIAGEYIREEVLDAYPEDLRSFLEVTCWLPILTEPLCAAVTALSSRPLPLVWSDLESLPIMHVASRPGAVRYPPVLARFVQHDSCRRGPQAATTARRQAAEACHSAGELITAVGLFLQAGCPDEAADVCTDLTVRGEVALREVDKLLHHLPDITPLGSRWLPWRIRAALAAGHLDEGRGLLEQAEQSFESTDQPDQPESLDLVVARGALAERTGNVAALLACADRVLATSELVPPRQVSLAHGWRVRALVWSGDMEGARAAVRSAGVASSPDVSGDVVLAGAWLAWLDGDITGASKIMAAHSDSSDDVERSPELALLAGSVHRERGRPAKALPLLRQAHSLASEFPHHPVKAVAASELARSHLAAGSFMDALELVVATRAAHTRLPLAIDAHLRSTEMRVRLAQGDVAGARALCHEAPNQVETQLLEARIALHQAPARARELLEAIDAQTPRQAVEKLLLLAQVPDVDQADASAALSAAISVGGHLGLVRTFLDESPSVRRQLQQLGLESPDRTLGRLAALLAQDLAQAPARESIELVEQLTSRELAVLRMLPLRLSNREMAAQMYISVNTLKTHVRAIYRKLAVPHRSAAVRRAKALQLV